jgi:hypothetical protein
VTYRGARGVHVEIFDSHAQAAARADQIGAHVGRVVIAEHGVALRPSTARSTRRQPEIGRS